MAPGRPTTGLDAAGPGYFDPLLLNGLPTAERTAMSIPSAEAVVLDGAGHMTHIDAREQWRSTIERFLHEADSVTPPSVTER